MKILIVRVGRLGDIVMITPALNLIRQNYPDAEFDFLTGNEVKKLIPFLPLKFSHILTYNRKSFFRFYHRFRLKKQIKQKNYDQIFCFETNPGYRSLFPQTSRVFSPVSETAHTCKMGLNTVNQAVKSPIELTRLNYPVSLLLDKTLITATEKHFSSNGIDNDTFIVAIHPSFSGLKKINKVIKRRFHKKWRNEHYAECVKKISEVLDKNAVKYRILMNLLPEDIPVGNAITGLSNGIAQEFILPAGFKYFIGYLNRVDLLIVPDTGPMHIAAALNTNIIALFSGERPEKCGPWISSPGVINVRAEDKQNKKGINQITGEDIATVFEKNLSVFLSRSYLKKIPKPV